MHVHWAALIEAGAAFLTLLIVAGGALKIRPRLKAHNQMVDDWNGAPERRGLSGHIIEEARPGMMERMRATETGLAEVKGELGAIRETQTTLLSDSSVLRGDAATIKEQLRPNGGDSTYDQAKRAADLAERVATVVEGSRK